MNDKNDSNTNGCATADVAYSAPVSRQLRTITLVEQVGPDGQIKWTMIEGSATAFGLDEPNLVHALTRQLYGVQTHLTRSIASISFNEFQHGFGAGRFAGAQEERGRAARARVQDEEAQESAAAEAKRAARRRPAAVKKTTAKRRAR